MTDVYSDQRTVYGSDLLSKLSSIDMGARGFLNDDFLKVTSMLRLAGPDGSDLAKACIKQACRSLSARTPDEVVSNL